VPIPAQEANLIPHLTPYSVASTAIVFPLLSRAWQFAHPANLPFGAWIGVAGFAWAVALPYLSGAVILVVGLVQFLRRETAQKPGLHSIVDLGPVFLAAAIAVFGAEHFVFSKIVAGMVPGWIPGHLFWALFVGACLIGAALSIAAGKYTGVAASLLGGMILLFVMLIHIPGIVNAPRNRMLWVVGLRDLAFSGGALAVAATQVEPWRAPLRQNLVLMARLFIAVPVTYLGVEHFLQPGHAPGVPLALLTPRWVPLPTLWAYLTGAVYVVAGLSLILNKDARLSATRLGITDLLLVLLLYVPIVVTNPTNIGNGLNYLADTLLLSGSALALAGALREN